MRGTQYFGYGTLSDWLDAIDPYERVWLREFVKKQSGGELPITHETHAILAAQPDEEGHLHFVLIEAAKIQRFDRMKTTDEQDRLLANAKRIREHVRAWIAEHVGGKILEGTPSLPDDRTHMTGWPEFIEPVKDEAGKIVDWRRTDRQDDVAL